MLKVGLLFVLLGVLWGCGHVQTQSPAKAEVVVLLHGMGRSASSMEVMEQHLRAAGYRTVNVDYPSTLLEFQAVARGYLDSVVRAEGLDTATRVHWVTHSLGGILMREYWGYRKPTNWGRAVQLAPPNQGSEIADFLTDMPGVTQYMGPNLRQLSHINKTLFDTLAIPNIEIGVLIGTRSINWINSMVLPGPDDGKVTLARSHLPGEKDWRAIKASHPFIMKDDTAIALTLRFLATGSFGDSGTSHPNTH